MSRWRAGRKLGRTLYLQDGSEPSDDDRFLGLMESEELAEIVVEATRRLFDDFQAAFEGSVWKPRRSRDPGYEDPLKVIHADAGGYLCRVLDGGSATVRRTGVELNLYYRREN